MHVLGKVFLWLCLLLSVGAIYLSSMLLGIRGGWLAEVEQRQKQIADNSKRLADVQQRVRTLEEEREGLVRNWGDVWLAPESGPQVGSTGVIEIGTGTGSGFAVDLPGRPAAKAYAFGLGQEGRAQYVGEFLITDKRADRSVGQLTRNLFLNEQDAWPTGVYRVRENLPPEWLAILADLEAQYIIADSNLKAQALELQIIQAQIQQSQEVLNRRLEELNGNPNPPEGADPAVGLGLVETLKQSEVSRNQKLYEVDQLRRQLDSLYVKVQETLSANQERVKDLEAAAHRSSAQPGILPTPQASAELPSSEPSSSR